MCISTTPTDANWLNEVELAARSRRRRLLHRGELHRVDGLACWVIAFINDDNKRAAPFRRTYDGLSTEGRASQQPSTVREHELEVAVGLTRSPSNRSGPSMHHDGDPSPSWLRCFFVITVTTRPRAIALPSTHRQIGDQKQIVGA